MADESAAKVQGRLVTDEVAALLRQRIHRGEWSPGDRLPPERILAEQLGVGRVTLREALAVLQSEGYLVAKRGAHGGSFVTELEVPYRTWVDKMRQDVQELRDILDYRDAVEIHAARLAASRRKDEHVRRMADAIEAFDRVGTLPQFRELDLEFHGAIAEAAGSPRLQLAAAGVRGELFLRADTLTFDLGIPEVVRQHGSILDAVRLGDPNAAAAATREHLDVTRQQLFQLLGIEL